MLTVGLTGGIGSGKSTVAARLRDLGAVVIDADALAREVIAPGTPGFALVVDAFGTDICTGSGELDRAALARRVFSDEAARRTLEAVVHPLVRQRANDLTAEAPPDAVVVNDIPLLVETGLHRDFERVLVVSATPQTRLDRLVRLRGLSPEEARARMAAQATEAERLAAADLVIDNNGTVEDLIAQVDRAWSILTAPSGRRPTAHPNPTH